MKLDAMGMFNEIGYYKHINDKDGFAFAPLNNERFCVGFRINEKNIVVINTAEDNKVNFIDIKLYTAIQKQVEELGWLND